MGQGDICYGSEHCRWYRYHPTNEKCNKISYTKKYSIRISICYYKRKAKLTPL